MIVDETEPAGNKIKFLDLEDMSIEALNDYITQLNSEIERVKSDISSKKIARIGAEKVFK